MSDPRLAAARAQAEAATDEQMARLARFGIDRAALALYFYDPKRFEAKYLRRP